MKNLEKASHSRELLKKGLLFAALVLLFISVARMPARAEGKNVKNILMIGSDRRDDSWNGNSDVMMIATINHDTKQIVLTSFMRDLYAEIPGHGTNKLNYAFAVGGAKKLQETLENNYQLTIDNYMIVDFKSMAKIIDIIGGVEVTISDDECNVLNGYLDSMGVPEDHLPGGGTYVMNGNQTVAHMRDRYVGNNDYERTQRQRDVLKQIFEGAKELTPVEMTALANEVINETENDFSTMEFLELTSILPNLTEYEMVEQRIPFDGLYSSQGEMLVPDFPATISQMHEVMGD